MKKKPKEFLQLQQEFYDNIEKKGLSPKLCHYVWDVLVRMNIGYGFNVSHTLAYSLIALQEANLAYHYPIIYWNTANLISDSGGEESTVAYGKIAKAVNNIQKEGTHVTLPDINRVRFDFRPDAEKNEIIYGLKPISGIGTKLAKAIIDLQPYTSMWDFYEKMQHFKSEVTINEDGEEEKNKFGDTAMITLIKAGAFDEIEQKPRTEIMKEFITYLSSPLKALKMQHILDLNKLGLLTESQKSYELRLYRFTKYLYQKDFFVKQTGKSPNTAWYRLDRKFAEPFFNQYFEANMSEGKDYEYDEEGYLIVKKGSLDREFKKLTEDFKDKVLTNQEFLDIINQHKMEELWQEKVPGTISCWEMQSLNFYYSGHELLNVNKKLYQIENFFDKPQEPELSGTYWYKGQEKPRFKLTRIAGTVLDKNKNKNTVTLLTLDGVVDVKFYKGQFSFYDKQIVEVDELGKKTTLEKSWFQRGNILLVTGFRRDEQFIPRKYTDSIFKHSLQLITAINEDGTLDLQSERIEVD